MKMKLIAILALVLCLSSVVICIQNEEEFNDDDFEDEDEGNHDNTIADNSESSDENEDDGDLNGDNSEEKDGNAKSNGVHFDDKTRARGFIHPAKDELLNVGRQNPEIDELKDLDKEIEAFIDDRKSKDPVLDQHLGFRQESRNQAPRGDDAKGVTPNEVGVKRNGENGGDEQKQEEKDSVGRRRRSTRRRRRR